MLSRSQTPAKPDVWFCRRKIALANFPNPAKGHVFTPPNGKMQGEPLLTLSAGNQLELFERPTLTRDDLAKAMADIRNHYWIIRNTRKDFRSHNARRRKTYREIAKIKKRLLEAGVNNRDLLDYLRHCRLQCRAECRFCSPADRLYKPF